MMLIESFCFAGGRVHKYQIESPKGDQKHRPRIFSHCLDDRPHNILHIYDVPNAGNEISLSPSMRPTLVFFRETVSNQPPLYF